jgi:D-hexose-6-phosphate mutarotase
MADFHDDGYLNMICVEVGRVSIPAQLGPAEVWEGTQTLVSL